jgi:hypothetical protein
MRMLWLGLVFCQISVYAQRGGAPAPPAGETRKNLKILPHDVNVPQVMAGIRAALGVQCNYCHNPIDFSSDENPRKSIARNMMRLVNDLNSGPLHDNMHVTCYTCHRGEAIPKSEAAAPEGRGGRGQQ